MKKKGGLKIKLGAAVAVLIVLAVVLGRGKGAPVLTAAIERGTARSYVEERARTSLPDICKLTMPQPGRVLPITLEEGDAVTRGQVVARLDNADLLDALKEADAVVQAMANVVAASEAQVRASRTRTDYLKWLWEAIDRVYKSQVVSQKMEREARSAYLQAAMDTEATTADSFAWKALDSVSRLLPIYVNRSLKRTVLESPIDGVVLKRYVRDETVLQPGEPLLEIGDLSRLQVTVEVLTEDAARIEAGDEVEIFGETVGESSLRGTVLRVKPSGFTKLSSLGVEQQRVDVVVAFAPGELRRLEKDGRRLGNGYRVRVRIYTASSRSEPAPPSSAAPAPSARSTGSKTAGSG